MFEEQSTAIHEYTDNGIRIGKVQVSSAVEVDFESGTDSERIAKRAQLASFAEPKYLHQTSVRVGDQSTFYEDLDQALAAAGESPQGKWRVHFHVPIFSHQLDLIGTTQSDIRRCLDSLRATGRPMPHFEVETYAWNVLPESLREDSLADGIAKELAWFDDLIQA